DRAIDAWAEQMPETLPEGWHISTLDLRPFINVFSPLSLKPGLILRAYQFFYFRDGETEIWALPETAVFPPPDSDSEDEPPKPPEALDNVMTAIRGDGSPWSYLSASILARELTEVGTFGHASEWTAYHILDANPLHSDPLSQNTSPDRAPTGTAVAWQWHEPEPDNWLPTVQIDGSQISVTFYTYCGLDTQLFTHHTDIYTVGSYIPQQQQQTIATGPEGYVW
ncbi:MAG: hypothetical protein GWP17_03960, partial [Aquificales bacterium]|nr:hypothetical protein [Aquificales bacterium]